MKQKKRRKLSAPYSFLVTFPDRVYPFASYINGEKVRWRRSYEHKLAQMQRRLGKGRYGIKLAAYREVFHVFGAAIVILAGTYVSKAVFGDTAGLPALFTLAMIVITYQEFVLQPRTYNQSFGKAMIDWVSWAAPLGMYLIYFVK